jgi:hypothetical protein
LALGTQTTRSIPSAITLEIAVAFEKGQLTVCKSIR